MRLSLPENRIRTHSLLYAIIVYTVFLPQNILFLLVYEVSICSDLFTLYPFFCCLFLPFSGPCTRDYFAAESGATSAFPWPGSAGGISLSDPCFVCTVWRGEESVFGKEKWLFMRVHLKSNFM